MTDFERYLRWISRVQILCSVALVASVVVGVMSIIGDFGPVLGVVLGVASVVVLVLSVSGLNAMSWRVFDVEESFHRRNYELQTTLLDGRPW